MLLGGAIMYLQLSGTRPGSVVELLARGGETLLRDPMRTPGSAARVLVFALDGVGDEEFRHAITSGGAPGIAALLGPAGEDPDLFGNAYAVPGALSILPSTTLAAWSSLFTGEPPARTGVPGNEWFVREEMKFYAPAPVSVTENAHALEVYTGDLIGQLLQVSTIYERANVRSYVSLSQLHRGADLLSTPDLSAIGALATAAAEGLAGRDEVSKDLYAELDQSSVRRLVKSLEEHGVPDLQVVYFPGVDIYTHAAEQPIPDQQQYIREVIDPSVQEVLREYREQGALRETYVLFVSDHGHTPVLNDERHALGTTGRDDPPALIEQLGFRMRPFVLDPPEDQQDYQAAVAYQGAMAYIYLADRSTCPPPGSRCSWILPPRLQEDVLPVVRGFDAANRTGAGIPELQGTLDLIFAREPRPTSQDALPFQIWNGERLLPIGEYLKANPRPDLLDLESRMEGLAVGPYGHRSGDVLLLARSGIERPLEDRFYFSDRYRSWHGSPAAQDSRIPLVVARAGRTGHELRDRLVRAVGARPSQLDVAQLILSLLTEG